MPWSRNARSRAAQRSSKSSRDSVPRTWCSDSVVRPRLVGARRTSRPTRARVCSRRGGRPPPTVYAAQRYGFVSGSCRFASSSCAFFDMLLPGSGWSLMPRPYRRGHGRADPRPHVHAPAPHRPRRRAPRGSGPQGRGRLSVAAMLSLGGVFAWHDGQCRHDRRTTAADHDEHASSADRARASETSPTTSATTTTTTTDARRPRRSTSSDVVDQRHRAHDHERELTDGARSPGTSPAPAASSPGR